MISQNSVTAVMALAQAAAAVGKTLAPQADTPLAELAKTSYLFDIPVIDPSTSLESVAELIASNTNNTEHNARHDYLIEAVANAASKHMDFARNVVVPAVEATAARLAKAVEGHVSTPLADFCVVMADLPMPLQNDGMLAAIAKDATGSYIEPEATFRFGEFGPGQVLALLETGSKVFDDKVREWAAIKGDTFFMGIWNDLFRSVIESQPENPRGFMEHIADLESGVDAAFAIYLIVRRLQLKPEAGSGLADVDYRRVAAQYQEVAAQAVQRRLDREAMYTKQQTLVLSWDARRKTIVVNGPLYRQWLKSGGKNEVLFGLLVAGDTNIHLDEITAKAAEGIRQWDRYASVSMAKHRNEAHKRFVDELRNAFYADMRAAGPEEKQYQLTHSEYLGRVHDYLEEQLDSIVTADISDLVRTVCRVVCRARYYFNDAYKILTSIDEAHRANPGLSVQDAVATARAEYVVDFISAQIRVI